MNFLLKLEWRNTPTITVKKFLVNSKDAKKWQKMCHKLCGHNEFGEIFRSSSLTDEKGNLIHYVLTEYNQLHRKP